MLGSKKVENSSFNSRSLKHLNLNVAFRYSDQILGFLPGMLLSKESKILKIKIASHILLI